MDISEDELKKLAERILELSDKSVVKDWEEGKKFMTKKGIKVRSKIEKIIADFYFDRDVEIEYEKKVVFPKMNSPEKYTFFCDFYLPEFGVYHEHFGMDGKDYIELRDIKRAAFRRFKMKFIDTSIEEEVEIEKAIAEKLGRLGINIR